MAVAICLPEDLMARRRLFFWTGVQDWNTGSHRGWEATRSRESLIGNTLNIYTEVLGDVVSINAGGEVDEVIPSIGSSSVVCGGG